MREDVDGLAVLTEMARSRSVDDRMWVALAAPEVLGAGAAPVLRSLIGDRDSDVRIEAMTGLAAVEPGAAQDLLPTLRKRLRSKDYYEPVNTMWAIARLGLIEAAPDIQEVATQWPDWVWQHKAAEIVLDLLQGRHDRILQRIRDHDHVAMPWLCRAATLMQSPEADATLTWGITAFADDKECLHYCVKALAG